LMQINRRTPRSSDDPAIEINRESAS